MGCWQQYYIKRSEDNSMEALTGLQPGGANSHLKSGNGIDLAQCPLVEGPGAERECAWLPRVQGPDLSDRAQAQPRRPLFWASRPGQNPVDKLFLEVSTIS